ncbi:MAG: type I restriction endonuclease subunit M [Nitrosospira sp.]
MGQAAREHATYPLFLLGEVVATQGVIKLADQPLLESSLNRHVRGDWGCVSEEDWKTNDEALNKGFRILSAYPIDTQMPCKGFGDNTLWIITESDRSVTTFLLPDEY